MQQTKTECLPVKQKDKVQHLLCLLLRLLLHLLSHDVYVVSLRGPQKEGHLGSGLTLIKAEVTQVSLGICGRAKAKVSIKAYKAGQSYSYLCPGTTAGGERNGKLSQATVQRQAALIIGLLLLQLNFHLQIQNKRMCYRGKVHFV